ncbi:hypothetical protein M405DRAFT_870140 [Rhizopogon salebrosus TDB-379]|nr:hypothetical protein M405DRAFT_870140 [Rhizopogon salebrosus TDB-379]
MSTLVLTTTPPLDSPRVLLRPTTCVMLRCPHLVSLCNPTNATFSTSAGWSTSYSKDIESTSSVKCSPASLSQHPYHLPAYAHRAPGTKCYSSSA